MRYAIIADIHANLAAFTVVLDDVYRRGGVEQLWCLGDIVGYGPDPHACIELLRQYDHICVAGNHDWAAVAKLDTAGFNPDAAAACRWTAQQLTTEDVGYLESLPLVVESGDFTLAHGSPRDPIWEYLLTTSSAEQNLAYFQTRFCLAGHSHVPRVFECIGNGACYLRGFSDEAVLKLAGDRLIVNPGGVGQPRDGDPRASYAIYDSETLTVSHYRIPYDIATTQAKILRQGLPVRLAGRLSYGM